MTAKRIEELIDRIGCVQRPCDLDLLLFFYRHPQAYLKGDRLAEYVGYDLPQVVQSLETLITAGLLRQSLNSSRPARLCVFTRSSYSRRIALVAPANRRNARRPAGRHPRSPTTTIARALEGFETFKPRRAVIDSLSTYGSSLGDRALAPRMRALS